MSERTKVAFSENVIAVLIRRNGKREIFRAKNLIGDAGDKNYAQRVCAESPTLAFTTQVHRRLSMSTRSVEPRRLSHSQPPR